MKINNKNNINDIIDLLDKVYKPARYIGIEPNSINKFNLYKKNNIYKFCISYPDLYEVGMSNLSIKIIYFLLNSIENIICERVFLPDDDLIKLLKNKSFPLFSLETWNFVKDFNMVGFSIHSELTYTNILKILELSKISIFRKERDDNEPIIIAGGSNILNPFPLSEFIDLFFIGEVEEILPSIIKEDRNLIKNKISRKDRIKAISKFDGIFNPELKNKTYRVFVKDLNNNYILKTDFLPLVKPIQDRVSVEIARGCVNGCRFCQAGYFYRPYREKSPKLIIEQIKEIIKNTGYEELNLTSLSISDYTNIIQLVKILDSLSIFNISISVPSLRLISFPLDLLDSLKIVRKAGLTFAIEAGNEYIRNKINKFFDEEKLFYLLELISIKGWNLIKFYFIIGFPNVTNEEIYIENLLKNINKKFPKLNINVNISLFIPKVKTPLQDYEQINISEYNAKCLYLKKSFEKNKRISIKYSDPYKSYFEYYFSQADTYASKLLSEALIYDKYRESWDEHFDKNFWKYLFDKYPLKKADFSLIENRIDDSFLNKEKSYYEKGIKTNNCIEKKCNNCGVCTDNFKNIIMEKLNEQEISKLKSEIENLTFIYSFNKTSEPQNYLLLFNKTDLMKYIGHIDFYTLTYRLLKKVGIDLIYSKGYNPMPKISFPYPAPINFETYNDLLILSCFSKFDDSDLEYRKTISKINYFLPDGFRITKIIKKKPEDIKNINLNIFYLLELKNSILEHNIDIFKIKNEIYELIKTNPNFMNFEIIDNDVILNNFINSYFANINTINFKTCFLIKFKSYVNIKENIKNPFKNFNNELINYFSIKRIFTFS
ncbi:MAG: DUF2344 domain-containing protein [Spirochaetes bacterium]|nr:DUF2344 domain-containing protein [Spirochaetota bacterium]